MYGRSLYGNREISRSTTGLWPSGPHREGDEPKPVMHEREKSDPAIVAKKPSNEAGRPDEEMVEPRAGAEENALQGGMPRTPSRTGMSPGLERVRQVAKVIPGPAPASPSPIQGGSRMP